jgi:hypothetical protein
MAIDAVVDLNGYSLTLTRAVADPNTATDPDLDVYNAGTLVALRTVVKTGTEINELTDQVMRSNNALAAVNNINNWGNTNWYDVTQGMAMSNALIDAKLIGAGTNPYTGAVAPANPNISYVTTKSLDPNSPLPDNLLVNWPPIDLTSSGSSVNWQGTGSLVLDPFPGMGDGGAHLYVDENGTVFVIDAIPGPLPDDPYTYRQYKADTSTIQLAYQPTNNQLNNWQNQRQSLVTQMGQISTSNNLILQSTTTTYVQELEAASAIQGNKADNKDAVVRNWT